MAEHGTSVFGQVDVLVNKAGIQHVEAIETYSAADMSKPADRPPSR